MYACVRVCFSGELSLTAGSNGAAEGKYTLSFVAAANVVLFVPGGSL